MLNRRRAPCRPLLEEECFLLPQEDSRSLATLPCVRSGGTKAASFQPRCWGASWATSSPAAARGTPATPVALKALTSVTVVVMVVVTAAAMEEEEEEEEEVLAS